VLSVANYKHGTYKMLLTNKTNLILLGFYMSLLSGCASTNSKAWSTDDIVNGSTPTAVTGISTSYGNQAMCNQYKTKCGSRYREWFKGGEIACSCALD